MTRRLIPVSVAILSGTALVWAAACSSSTSSSPPGSGSSSSGGSSSGAGSSGAGSSSGSKGGSSSSGGSGSGAGSSSGAGSGGSSGTAVTYVKIDDMETTGGPDGGSTNGPIELTGLPTGEYPGYWYDGVSSSDPRNTVTPPNNMYTYSVLPAPHTTMTGVTSAHGAHVACPIWDQYGFCQQAFEFAQVNVDAAAPEGGATPRVTAAFDISQYNGITFWVMAGPKMDATAKIRVLFPDIDSDPRGNRCGGDAGQCYDSWSYVIPSAMVTSSWTQVSVAYAPADGVLAAQSFGFEAPHFDPAHVYGIGFQVSGPSVMDASAAVNADYWIDDIYFTK